MRFSPRRSARFVALSLFIVLCSFSLAFAGHGETNAQKKGILLVAFGTSIKEAQKSFDNMEKQVKKACPGIPVRWAFTSNIIRHKLDKQGQHTTSVPSALAGMLDEGFTDIAVQSLHTIPGEEFHQKVLDVVNRFRGGHGGFNSIVIGQPMMATPHDVEAVVEAIQTVIPKQRKADEAVVLMGHGTHHPGNIYYPGLQWYLSQKDANILVGTVEGTPSLDYVVSELKKRGTKTVWLMPLMSVAGDHARNDMAGAEDDSWKSVLEANGIKVNAILKGTAEYDAFAALWVKHVKTAVAALN